MLVNPKHAKIEEGNFNRKLLAHYDGNDENRITHQEYKEDENVIIRALAEEKESSFKISAIKEKKVFDDWKAWIFLAPVIILFAIFFLYPFINTVVISFLKDYDVSTGVSTGFTLDNYKAIFDVGFSGVNHFDDFIKYALPNTLILTVISVPLSIVLALAIALLVYRIKFVRKLVSSLYMIPYISNILAIGMVFAVIFNTDHLINSLFETYGMSWIDSGNRFVALLPVSLYLIWSNLPLKIMLFLFGIESMDKKCLDAARADGANYFKTVFKVIIPMLLPQILFLVITSIIDALKEYMAIVTLYNPANHLNIGSNGLYTMSLFIIDNIKNNTSVAAAASVVLFLLSFAIMCGVLIFMKLRKRSR